MQRARLAPNVISGLRDSVVILDASLQDKRLLDLGMFVKGDVSAGFELKQTSHLAALGILVKHLDRDFFESGWPPVHLGRLDVCRPADGGGQTVGSVVTALMVAPWFRYATDIVAIDGIVYTVEGVRGAADRGS
jgi:hypothetical protein